MAPVILVTFAGRQRRMEILNRYIRKAMEYGIIDEWHIWDFTRSAEDHDWVTREFGPARFMASKVPYQAAGTVSSRAAFRTGARITNDLHIALIPNDRPDECFEIVLGGWNNTHSALRKIKPSDLTHFERGEIPLLWSKSTPAVLSPSIANQIVLTLDDEGIPTLKVNDVLVGHWPDLKLPAGASVMVRGGWGGDLELCDISDRVRRYIGNPNEPMPYWQAYDYYSKRVSEFSDALFLKCDDDIVYLDLDKLSAFIEFRRSNPHYFVVSANVLNNGVCAYFQQAAGALPHSLGHFERPPGGFGGSLWLSPSRATDLHDYFLQKADKHLPLASPVIDWTERQSINFIAWLGKDLVHMALPKGDDEFALTVDVPTFLGRPTAIYSDFVVSHLSFGPQEKSNEMDLDRLIAGYEKVMLAKLSD